MGAAQPDYSEMLLDYRRRIPTPAVETHRLEATGTAGSSALLGSRRSSG